MSRRPSPTIGQRNAAVLARIQALKAEHPFWGYRRIWAQLRFGESLVVNKKRVLRLMRTHGLLVMGNPRLKATRTPMRSKPRPTAPNQWWGIDMTKVMVEPIGWVYVVLVLDWYTKKIVGHYAGLQAKTGHWLAALDSAVQRQCPHGSRDHGLHLMSDTGCQPTAVAFMKAAATLGITQAFTSYNNPKGNADTERLMRTLKEELLWLREWTSSLELERAIGAWIEWYNTRYLHSALGYRTPCQIEQQHLLSHSNTQFVAA
ncbi:MAG: IS3 family transposase [Nitrospiraceae bacterium]